ncbi:hypothetical protein TanjilG_12000 [Lupinus angustifolius]|uniref:PPM-type phosphatase domain-containing protein n=1 Tax=Lupinus angustifolius TaxID=3871 RepID=A0A1J7HSG8_LUPAN|nr:PREDICTED: probable protein phosphatase 2C 72 [Lupinus angustifolius]OIW03403.1 hypothetical protein TanjilG_12000 [Lupinus angustifolius]
MGICISIASSEIHGPSEEVHDENVIIFEGNKVPNVNQKLFSVYSRQGAKGLNQDAASLHKSYGMEDGSFCGVFDGHGRNGHIVSKMVNKHLASLILSQNNAIAKIDTTENSDVSDDNTSSHVDTPESDSTLKFQKWKQAIFSAFKVMDKEVKLQENLDFSCSGTTAVVVIRQGEDLVIANLGDSRAVLGRIHDEELIAIQLTTDLKPGLPCEAERIRSCNGCVYALEEEPNIQRVWLPNEKAPGLAMSRAFGDFLLKDHGVIAIPDISYHTLTPTDQFILLATDGVWDVLSNNEVASIVWTAATEDAAARAVVEGATAAWKKKYPTSKVDDITVVCLFMQKKSQNLSLCL